MRQKGGGGMAHVHYQFITQPSQLSLSDLVPVFPLFSGRLPPASPPPSPTFLGSARQPGWTKGQGGAGEGKRSGRGRERGGGEDRAREEKKDDGRKREKSDSERP